MEIELSMNDSIKGKIDRRMLDETGVGVVVFSLEEIMKQLPMGKFQIILMTLCTFAYMCTSVVTYNYCFLLLRPVYECTVLNEGSLVTDS